MMTTTAQPRLTLRPLRGWPLFITLSLLFHLLVLLLWYLLTPDQVTVRDAPMAPFAVHIESAPQLPAAAPAEPPRAVSPPPEKIAPAPAAKPAQPQETIAQPVVKQPAATPQPPAAGTPQPFEERDMGTSQRLLDTFPDAGAPVAPPPAPEGKKPDDESRLQIESLIRTRFAEHFVYPRMARSQGWQGEVLLSFHIEPDGTVSHIQVARGSGHAILDQAALDSMRSIERIEFTPGIVLRHQLELHMPVIYHLAQG